MGACNSSVNHGSVSSFTSFDGRVPSKGDFEVMATLGIGSFGTVSCCRRKGTSEFLAIKTVRKGRLFRRTDHSALVWNERDTMIKCKSPFLVNLLAAFQSTEDLYFVMPFHTGGDLGCMIRMNGVPKPAFVRFYLAEVICALEAMHELNICHRDIKPDNMLIDAEGHLVVIDFGLAIEIDPDDHRHPSRHWGQCGSYGYRAPEVVKDRVCGPPSDIYSLGAATYFMLYGRLPWPQTQHGIEGAPLVFSVVDDSICSEQLMRIITRMLDFNPVTRITIQELKDSDLFENVDWDKVVRKRKKSGLGKAPYVPDPNTFCYPLADPASAGSSTQKYKPLTPAQQQAFTGFGWVANMVHEEPVLQGTVQGSETGDVESTNAVHLTPKDTTEGTHGATLRASSRQNISGVIPTPEAADNGEREKLLQRNREHEMTKGYARSPQVSNMRSMKLSKGQLAGGPITNRTEVPAKALSQRLAKLAPTLVLNTSGTGSKADSPASPASPDPKDPPRTPDLKGVLPASQ